MKRLVIAAFVFAAISLPGCRAGGGAGTACVSPTPTNAVNLADFRFDPSCATARAGTTLTLTDGGAAPHTYTVTGTPINVKLEAGQSHQVSLSGVAPGTYAVVCLYHPQMTGQLKIA